jgi:hypothetical protein
LNKDDFFYSYFALVFFEAVLVLPIIGGTFFRVYQFLFLFRLLYDFNKRILFKRNYILNFLTAITFLILSFSFANLNQYFSLMINVFITAYIFLNTTSYSGKKLHNVFLYIAIFSILSGIYGLFFIKPIDYGTFYRFVGVMGDPNYSALFYTLGIFGVIGSNIQNKAIKLTLFSLSSLLLLSTVSISGILITTFLLLTYQLIRNPSVTFFNSLLLLPFLLFLLFDFEFETGTIFFGIQSRIATLFSGNSLDSLSSNRSSLFTAYLNEFKQLPLYNQLFGGLNIFNPDLKIFYTMKFGNVSHLSYLDMLFMIGMIGSFFLILLFISIVISNFFQYKKTKNLYYLLLAYLKLTILFYGLTISIFPFRYFYLILLI